MRDATIEHGPGPASPRALARLRRVTLTAMLLAFTMPALASPGGRLVDDLGAPAQVHEFGTIRAEQRGVSGPAVILVPGLAGGAWAWDTVVRPLQSRFTVHALTLAGADGHPAPAGPLMDKVVDDMARFIRSRQPGRPPILVGHSMGAYIALKLAARHPGLASAVVTVDGFPVFPPLAALGEAERAAAARKFAADLIGNKPPEQYRDSMRAFIAARVGHPVLGPKAAALAANSDPDATSRYLVEMLAGDLRAQLARIDVPVFALAATESYRAGRPEAEMREFYAGLLRGAPRASVVLVSQSKHFVMQDQPAAVAAAIEAIASALELR